MLSQEERLLVIMEVNWRRKNREKDEAEATQFGRRKQQPWESDKEYEYRLYTEDIMEVGADLALVGLVGGEVYWPHTSEYPLYDVTLPSEKRVDNKYSIYNVEDCWLADKVKTNPNGKPLPDLFVLFRGRFPWYNLVGWMSYEELKVPERWHDRWWKDFVTVRKGQLMPSPCHVASPAELHPSEEEAIKHATVFGVRGAAEAADQSEKLHDLGADTRPA